jgi:hypothetical protein
MSYSKFDIVRSYVEVFDVVGHVRKCIYNFFIIAIYHHHHQFINAPTAGAQAFLMDYA